MSAPLPTLSGAAYGVALNDAGQVAALADAFARPPYKGAPVAPVLYIKPRTCFSFGGAVTPIPEEVAEVQVAATIGLLFARDLCGAGPGDVRAAIGAACLALDISEPCDSFYRPAIRQQCRDGFLPLGGFAALPATIDEIVTAIDGHEVHRWSVDRLVRPLEQLAAEISGFMTLRAGDLLLVGLAGDAPRARAGQTVSVTCAGLPRLSSALVGERDL